VHASSGKQAQFSWPSTQVSVVDGSGSPVVVGVSLLAVVLVAGSEVAVAPVVAGIVVVRSTIVELPLSSVRPPLEHPNITTVAAAAAHLYQAMGASLAARSGAVNRPYAAQSRQDDRPLPGITVSRRRCEVPRTPGRACARRRNAKHTSMRSDDAAEHRPMKQKLATLDLAEHLVDVTTAQFTCVASCMSCLWEQDAIGERSPPARGAGPSPRCLPSACT